MPRRFSSLSVALVALAVALAACSTAAPAGPVNTSGPMEKVRIGVGGITKVIYAPPVLAEQLGYFKAEGLDVVVSDEQSGANVETEMLAGHLEGVVGFMDHSVALQAKGKCVESIVQFANVPLEKVMVRSDAAATVKTAADWRGKPVGYTSTGSSTDALMQAIAAKAGVSRADYTPSPVGAGSTFIASIERGDGITVGMTTPPTSTTLIKKGTAKVLMDLSTVEGTKAALGGLYPASSLYVTCEWAKAHPREAQALANALVKTLRYIKAHTATEIADKMPSDYAGNDKDTYVKSWEETKDGFTPDGVIDAAAMANVLEIQALVVPDVAAHRSEVKLNETYTTEFVKKVSAA
jgi:NitT/TauT family transport system substrate-binding protein